MLLPEDQDAGILHYLISRDARDFIGRGWGHITRGDNYQWPFQDWGLYHACGYDSNLGT